MPVERIVEKVVEIPVDRVVEKIVEVPVENIIEKVLPRPLPRTFSTFFCTNACIALSAVSTFGRTFGELNVSSIITRNECCPPPVVVDGFFFE